MQHRLMGSRLFRHLLTVSGLSSLSRQDRRQPALVAFAGYFMSVTGIVDFLPDMFIYIHLFRRRRNNMDALRDVTNATQGKVHQKTKSSALN